MPIEFPSSADEVVNRVKSDIQGQLPESNPFLKNSFMQAFASATGFRIFDLYKLAESQGKQFFPQTAEDEFLDFFADQRGIIRNGPTPSSGKAIFSGSVAGVVIEISALLSFSDITFQTLEEGTLSANTVAVAQITQSSGIATITFVDNHGLASGVDIIISGADQANYNGTKTVEVIDALEATFDVASNTTTPATGTIVADYNVASITVQSTDTGSTTNVSGGGVLVLQNPIVNVNDNAFVDLDGLVGGEDQETQSSYRTRILQAFANPLALFNEAAITKQAQLINGVTRVFVMRATDNVNGSYNKDKAGFVTVFFVKDGESNIIPLAPDITNVKNSILEILPSDKVSVNLIVLAPTAVPVDVIFTAISPDTLTMRTAITENIVAFFSGSNGMNGVETFDENDGDILINNLNLAILQTVDKTTGQQLESYDLSTPLANIIIPDGRIAVAGTITIP